MIKVKEPSLSGLFTFLVAVTVLFTSIGTTFLFLQTYRKAMEQNAVTISEQAVVQVENMIESYTCDIETVMDVVRESMRKDEKDRERSIRSIIDIGKDVEAIAIYDENGEILNRWTDDPNLKGNEDRNLSYIEFTEKEGALNISNPYVKPLFVGDHPWVVTISQMMEDAYGAQVRVTVDIQFSNIADYIDDVGSGPHGYCYIADQDGNVIYHPQQQLVYSELKEEKIGTEDGSKIKSNVIYTSRPVKNCNWRIVGICYVDEMITTKVYSMIRILLFLLLIVMISTLFAGTVISRLFSRPAKQLTKAMREFEKNAKDFTYHQVSGTEEITDLSNSFAHMVIRIQKLMEKVKKEELTLRKTELKALQAQINPHFLYNTLDAIAWLCEDGRNEDAEEMVNALAKLFRISISKGHELIPIEKEIEHAESYLKIEKFRYKNQFTYRFDVDKECLPYLCNKITLQPIIENAIYHGMNRMVDEGEILIIVKEYEEDIIMAVEDNGVGMSEEKCREILNHEPGDHTGIGIKNVNDRIKIYFGEEYGLTIRSEVDVGTAVTIRMPKVTNIFEPF